ncbi:MAG: hypothetical protein QNJ51_10775 [Calothrix sp. MO_167.B12]|nr:hypothetical protein [Calothrix sp. MO_167.B12]
MKSFYHSLTIISTISAVLGSLTAPAIAAEWVGDGRVVSGSGYKGTVRLALTKTGNRVIFHSGPDRGKSVTLTQSSVRTNSGNSWQFSRCGDRSEKLCVTLRQSRPRREIYYLLRAKY